MDNVIYVTGGTSAPTDTQARSNFLSLDLSKTGSKWVGLESIPGDGRIMPVIASVAGKVFVAGGARLYPGDEGRPTREYLRTGFRYDPNSKAESKWVPIADMPRASVAAPSPSPKVGPAHFLVLGGDNGEGLPPAVALKDHQGFARDLLGYHVITNTWAVQGEMSFAHVTGPLIEHGGRMIIPTGEIRPGVRSPKAFKGSVLPMKAPFGVINYGVLILYLLAVTVIGLWMTGANQNTNDFFRGGGTIPWWAAGLSIFATMSSSIGYLAITARSYMDDWVWMLTSLPILLLAPIIIRFYLPFFRHVDSSSAYEFLERRFSVFLRLFGSFAFVLFHMGRMAIVLYLPALAIATVTALDQTVCILLMGVLCIIYCAAGGIRAVVFTDSLQAVVLLGALFLSLVFAITSIEGGISTFISVGSEDNKFRIADLSMSPYVAGLWVVIVGNLFANLLPYTADQAVVQRYMTTKDMKAASRSIWTNAILAVPNTFLMFLLGTALYVFYKSFPEKLTPALTTNDAIFPLFIANELPIGLAGLAIAGVLAAAQSTVSTSINSISTVLMVDVVGRLGLTKKGAKDLALARILSVAAGIAGTGVALYVAQGGSPSLWETYVKILGLTGGSLAGLFILGIFTTRANSIGAATGAILSVPVLWYVQSYTPIHPFLYAVVGVGVTVIVGYTVSLFTQPMESEQLKGLTLHTIEK
jgi:SSS family transporter